MNNEKIMTTDEAANYLKTTKKTFLKMVHEGKIIGNKVGRGYRFLREDLDNYIRCKLEQ